MKFLVDKDVESEKNIFHFLESLEKSFNSQNFNLLYHRIKINLSFMNMHNLNNSTAIPYILEMYSNKPNILCGQIKLVTSF
jgi:hypothetical protein